MRELCLLVLLAPPRLKETLVGFLLESDRFSGKIFAEPAMLSVCTIFPRFRHIQDLC